MTTNIIVGIIVFIVIIASLLILRAWIKRQQRREFVDELQVKFMNLYADAKSINEPYLKETSKYLMYSATLSKDNEKVKIDLLNILDKYKEAGKLSKDDFYEKAHNAIIKTKWILKGGAASFLLVLLTFNVAFDNIKM